MQPSMAPPSAYSQPSVSASAPVSTSYSMTTAVPAVRFRLPTLAKAPIVKPLPHPAPGLLYQPKVGTVVGGPGGGLPSLPVPGGTITEDDIPTESLSDRFWGWWSPMPLSQKGLAAGAALAALGGTWWLIWGKKKRATANRRRRTKHSRRR